MKKQHIDRLSILTDDLNKCLINNEHYQIDNWYIKDVLSSLKECQFELQPPRYELTDRDKFIILIMLSTINCVLNNTEKFDYYSNMAEQIGNEMELTEDERESFIELISKYPGRTE